MVLARARKLREVLRRPEYRRALLHGVAASVEHEAIPLRNDFATVIDVGANRGQFAVFASRRFPHAMLMCFEPLPGARKRLRRAVGNSGGVRLSEMAVGAYNGEGELHVSAADDSSSLLPIGRLQREAFPGTDERARISVQVRRLDDLLDRQALAGPVLMKVDVQGGELGVLEGAQRTLASVDALLVEVSFVALYTGQPLADEVFEYLRGKQFSCRGVWSLTYGRGRECLQGDFLFARDGFEPLRS